MPNPRDALTIEEHFFADDGRVPNNPSLPLIVYRSALETGPRCVADCETLFADNGWSGAWRNGIYAHHHYHSTAHEVLGIAGGSVRVRLGGEHGTTVELHAGDVVVIPSGASPSRRVPTKYPAPHIPLALSSSASQSRRICSASPSSFSVITVLVCAVKTNVPAGSASKLTTRS